MLSCEEVWRQAELVLLVIDCDGAIVLASDLARDALQLNLPHGANGQLDSALPELGSPVRHCLDGVRAARAVPLKLRGEPWLLDVVPVGSRGRVVAAVCLLHPDNKERNQQEPDTVSIPNRHLETIFDGSSDGIWVCDGRGRILRINAASSKLNGVMPEEVVGKNVSDLLESREFDQSVTAKVMASGRQETVMQYIARTRRFLLSTGTPSFDQNGNIDLIVINERDMTELNMLRKQVEEGQKVKEKITEELSELSLLEVERNAIIAESSRMRQLLQMSLKLSNLGASNILILGESGTGKGFLAKLIHRNSRRRKMPFIEINCAALPENLLEAELFGYERGAFTGAASKGKVGLVELANSGTLFLDEIGDMPLALQAKLLKYLDSQEIRRVGGTETIKISCSIIAATNQNLASLVSQKRFREDLYYRLNSFTLKLPPLRERREDVAGLVRFYLGEFNSKYGCSKTISPSGMQLLLSYSFPGNIRELKNIIENGVVLSDSTHIDAFIKAGTVGEPAAESLGPDRHDSAAGSGLAAKLAEVERQCLLEARQNCRTTREMAAALGISQPSVVRKMKLHGLS